MVVWGSGFPVGGVGGLWSGAFWVFWFGLSIKNNPGKNGAGEQASIRLWKELVSLSFIQQISRTGFHESFG